MNIIINDSNQYHLIRIVDEIEDEIEVTVEPIDYVNNKYSIDAYDKRLKVKGNAILSIPVDSLSTTFKGKIGENASCIRRNLSRAEAEDFYYLTEPGSTYDLTNCSGTAKIEVKTGFEKHYGKTGKATSFNFFLATNHPGQNGAQISKAKFKKNYEAEGINVVEFVGIFNDSSKLPDIYVQSTNSNEIRKNSTIGIPTSGKSKYAKYKKDISDSYKA